MDFEYSERLPVRNNKTIAELVTSGIVYNRPQVEVEVQNVYNEDKAELVLKYTNHEERDCERRHIVVSGEDDELTINALATSDEPLPGLQVGMKSVVRNIRASLAGKASSEAV